MKMNEWEIERNESMDGSLDGKNEGKHIWKNGWMIEWKGCMNAWMNDQKDACMDEWIILKESFLGIPSECKRNLPG